MKEGPYITMLLLTSSICRDEYQSFQDSDFHNSICEGMIEEVMDVLE